MRYTERTKEAERNISEGGVGNDTFVYNNSRNIHIGCNITDTKNSDLFHSRGAVFFFSSVSPLVVVCISLPQRYQRADLS